jgi:hypothetical protein
MPGPERGDQRQDIPDVRSGDDAASRLREEIQQRARGEQWAKGEIRAVTNADGSITQKYPDGTNLKVEGGKSARVLEVLAINGDKTTFKYKGDSQQPESYQVEDANGKIKEKASKSGDHWKIDRLNVESGKYYHDKSWEIKDLKLQPDGRIDLIDKSGMHHERQRNGNYLRRAADGSGRVLAEMTWTGRTTEYEYQGRDMQPSAYTLKDKEGNITQHGTKDGDAWAIYKVKEGEKGLDPKNIQDAAHKVETDKPDSVVQVVLDQKTGKRVEVHADQSANWQALDDDRLFRRNFDGSMTVVGKAADGNSHLLYLRDKRGLKTTFDYDKTGSLTGEKVEYPNGDVRTWNKDGETTWRDSEGRTMHARADIKHDGSVSFNYLEKKNVLTWHPTGSEVVRHEDEAGFLRTLHTTDCHGKETQFKYSEDGSLSSLYVTFANGKTAEWLRSNKDGKDVWTLSGSNKKFEGTASIEEDGSVVWTMPDGRKQRADLRGIDYDVTAKK